MLRVRGSDRRPPLTLRLAPVALAVALLAGGCSWLAGEETSSVDESLIGSDQCAQNDLERELFIPDFYEIDCPLPGASHPGKLMRSELLSDAPDGTRAWRIMYRSTTAGGEPTAVSGLVVAPEGPAPADGFPVVAFAHSTTGAARQCAPSVAPAEWNGDVRSPTAFELLTPLVEAGYAVVATDYRGLGTPGPHPYLVGEEESRNVLDSVRALRELTDLPTTDTTFLYGHSQGGHAVAFAVETGADYAPDVPVAGAVEVAPAAQLASLVSGRYAAEPPFGSVLRMTLVGVWSAFYEDARSEQVLASEAAPDLAVVFEQCLSRAGAELVALEESAVFTHDLDEEPTWQRLLEVNTPGHSGSEVPVLVLQGAADPIVRSPTTRRYVSRLCGVGQRVDYREFPGESHDSILPASMAAAVGWMAERSAGLPMTGRC